VERNALVGRPSVVGGYHAATMLPYRCGHAGDRAPAYKGGNNRGCPNGARPSGRKPPVPVLHLITVMHLKSCRYRRSPTTRARQLGDFLRSECGQQGQNPTRTIRGVTPLEGKSLRGPIGESTITLRVVTNIQML